MAVQAQQRLDDDALRRVTDLFLNNAVDYSDEQIDLFDVAVDIRRGSATYGAWVGVELSEDNHKQLWIPPGLAHGFLVTSESADFLYKTTDDYAPQLERSIAWNDPDLAIDWPLHLLNGAAPALSAKDQAAMAFAQAT